MSVFKTTVRELGRELEAKQAEAKSAWAEFASEVVVADAGVAERGFLRTGARAQRLGARGDTHQCFEQASNVRVGEAVVAMTPLRFSCDEASRGELVEMRTCRLLGDASFEREFARR